MNGNINTYLITGLTPATEYEVLLAAIYDNEVESDEIILLETTGRSLGTFTPFKLRHGENRSHNIYKVLYS